MMLAGIQKNGQPQSKPVREISTINGKINRSASTFVYNNEQSFDSSENSVSGGTEEILEQLNAA